MTPPSTPERGLARPGARMYLLLFAGYLVFVIYGSLIPFAYRALTWSEATDRWARVCDGGFVLDSRSDFTANILLFMPLSFFLVGALATDRGRVSAVLAALLVVPLCAALSTAIEFTQLFFPPRVTAVSDIVGESLGALLGAVIWIAVGQRFSDLAHTLSNTQVGRSAVARLLPAYLLFLVIVHVMPLDLTLSPADLVRKYRQGSIVLVPFTANYGSLAWMFGKNLWNMAYFLPVGLLIALLRGRSLASGWHVLGVGLVVAGGIKFLQLFVMSRSCDITDILTGAGAVWLGWWLPQIWPHALPGWSSLRPFLFAAWLVLQVLVNWYPFDFNPDLDTALARLGRVSPVPLMDLYWGSPFHAFEEVLKKTLLFLPLGALLASSSPERRSGDPWRVLLAGLLISGVFELGQLFLPTRYCSVTDVCIEAVWRLC